MKVFTTVTLITKVHPNTRRYVSEPVLVEPSKVSLANGIYDTLTDLIVLAPKLFDLELHIWSKPITGSLKTPPPFGEAENFLGLIDDVRPEIEWMGVSIYQEHGLRIPILSRSDDKKVYIYVTSAMSRGIPSQITLKIGVESA